MFSQDVRADCQMDLAMLKIFFQNASDCLDSVFS